MTETLLVTISGPDRPGGHNASAGRARPIGVPVLDIEQVVIRGHLALGLLLSTDTASQVERTAAIDSVRGCRRAWTRMRNNTRLPETGARRTIASS